MSSPINERSIASPQRKKISLYAYLCLRGNMRVNSAEATDCFYDVGGRVAFGKELLEKNI